MSKKLSATDVIKHKNTSIATLNKMLDDFIDDHTESHLKKADLISYWLESFTKYVKAEESFSPERLLRYKRGSVIRVNFGFNIGKEFGGLHYAIVIDNDNKRNADVVTVIPLSSSDGKKIHERSVDLGTELFGKVSAIQQSLLQNAIDELEEIQKLKMSFDATVDVLRNFDSPDLTPEILNTLKDAMKVQADISGKEEALQNTIKNIERNKKEFMKMKVGNMALVNQITTVSKQRIYTPKRAEDFLYGISLSAPAMEKINDKIKELYIFK